MTTDDPQGRPDAGRDRGAGAAAGEVAGGGGVGTHHAREGAPGRGGEEAGRDQGLQRRGSQRHQEDDRGSYLQDAKDLHVLRTTPSFFNEHK